MTTPQRRWGPSHPQPKTWSGPDVTPYPPVPGWRQQSKWRRKVQQLQSTGSAAAPGAVTVNLTTCQVNVTALVPTVPQSIALATSRVNVAALVPTVPAAPALTVAQVNVQAYAPTFTTMVRGWQQQSKWRRRVTQRQSTGPLGAVTVPMATAQVVVSALAPTVPQSVVLGVAQVNVTALPVNPVYPGIGGPPQHRWGPTGPQTPFPQWIAPAAVVVQLATAQVVVQAYPVTIPVTIQAWQPQSKWRRKTQQQVSKGIQPWVVNMTTTQVIVTAYPVVPTFTPPIDTGGQGVTGIIKVSYTDPSTYVMTHSLAGAVQVDSYGNALTVGFQGPISMFKPGVSNPSATETWNALSLTANATASGNGVNGFFYRLSAENEVELLWDVQLLATSGVVGTLPRAYVPLVDSNMSSGWYGTGPGSWNSTFSPHWLIRGRSYSNPGQIIMEGSPTLNLNLFGRDKFSLDVT